MKNVFTISSETSFLDALADGLWERAKGDATRLADMRVLLPTRRACRMLREAFLRLTQDKPTLLPRMQPIGDVDEDELLFADAAIDANIPPAIAPLRRRLLLAQLIKRRDAAMSMDQAVHLAEALGHFLDEAQIRRCDFARLPDLVENRELAQHWQETVQFLSILTDAWPAILAEEGCLDPAERRNRVLVAQAAAWRAKPPNFPLIAAGSTGTMPATAELLDTIASLPLGAVVLPGIDRDMDEEQWQAVDELHPQHGMKELLNVMVFDRAKVKDWAEPQAISARFSLLREAMRPARVTEEWRNLRPEKIPTEALKGLSRASFAHPQEEAQAVALMLRQALQEPEKSVALVTPDRNLAERVVVLLARWGIEANDSAGSVLAEQPIGSYLAALIAAAVPHAEAVDWLSFLKHPYTACGLSLAECRAKARHVELTLWRTEKPEPSLWLETIRAALQPLSVTWNHERPLAAWIDDHLKLAELLAATDKEKGADRLWQQEDGEAAASWMNDLREASRGFPPISGDTYENLFGELLRQASFRPTRGAHPRLSILGPLEARLLRPDVVVLGGMNEGVWPPEVAVDPWMSRPMKKDFGMAVAEYRIGLSAHDFIQLACAPKVIMTRSVRAGGSPTVPSRFLLQLETVLRALGHSDKDKDALQPIEPWQAWARMLDEPEPQQIKPCAPPEPKPPVELRPKQLSVTEIGLWQRNPYAIYARHVLGLRKLDPLEAELDAADRGNLIHVILEKFVRDYPENLPPDALAKLLVIGREKFDVYKAHADVQAFWWTRFERIADWFIAVEGERRSVGIRPVAVEVSGKIAFDDFVLKGRADRIDRLVDGSLSIIDYKTGAVPKDKEVESGLEPQLPLLSIIAARGGFEGVKAAPSAEISYWKLGGGRSDDSNKEKPITENIAVLAAEAEDGLKKLIAAFADPATAYQAVPKPLRAPRYDDYAHLARLAEWGRSDED